MLKIYIEIMYMKFRTKLVIIFFSILLLLILYTYTLPRYVRILPTIPFYDNSEANLVKEIADKRTMKDEEFFYLTDSSVAYAFLPHVEESIEELRDIIMGVRVLLLMYLFKYFINRPRPYQINKDIHYLESKTGNTPALPAGHALQAYYLAHVLSKKYPNKKDTFIRIARDCDNVRVKAGIHYPSDGKFSIMLLNMFGFML